MRRAVASIPALIVQLYFLALASPALAGSTTPISMTLAEPTMPGIVSGCPISPQDGLCGSGEVIPFGHATDTILFNGACGGACDLRTITLSGGSIVSHEVFSDPTCPGVCGSHGRGGPQFGSLTDVIVGGTGIFAGATGSFSGSVTGAGTAGVAQLAGTITLAN